MDGMQWMFIGICVCIVAYGALAGWGWLVTRWTGFPSVFLVGIYGDEVYQRFTLPTARRRRIHRISSPMMRLHSVKLRTLRTSSENTVARIAMRATGGATVSAIDPAKIAMLHNLIAAGVVVNRTTAIETLFSVNRSGNPRSTYARICAALDAHATAQSATTAERADIAINPRKADAPTPAEDADDAPPVNLYPLGDPRIVAPSWQESMAELRQPAA